LKSKRSAALLFLLVLLVYLPSWRAQPFDDDYSMIRDGDEVRRNGLLSPFQQAQTWGWYRPVRALAGAIAMAPGALPWGPHLLNVLVHGASALVLLAIGLRILPDRRAAVSAVALFVLSQTNSMAVLSVDGFSELGVALAWLAGMLAVLRAAEGSRPAAAASVAIFLLGLLTKESMVAFPISVLAASLLYPKRGVVGKLAALHFALLVVFLLFRQYVAGGSAPSLSPEAGEYRFAIGASTLRNAGLFLFSLATPISSVRLATKAGTGQWVFAVGASLFFLGAVAGGIRSAVDHGHLRSRTCLFLLLWIASSTLPNLLLVHVSELYTYRISAPFFLLAAIAFSAPLFARARGALRAAAVLWLLLNLYAIYEKQLGISEAGSRAELILRSVRETTPDPEPNAHFHIYDEWGAFDGRQYGVFSVHGVRVFRTMLDYALNRAYGRTDLTASVDEGPEVDRAAIEDRAPGRHVYRYFVEKDRVEKLQP
jgi:hypothetical protein